MREKDMRQRVERFLQTRLRTMLLPATLGLGLAVSACDSEGLSTDDGGDPDAGLPLPTPEYMAQSPDVRINLDDMVLRYQAQMPVDAAADVERNVALYMAQLPRS